MDEPAPLPRTRRLVSRVYDAGADGREPLLDGPGWLIALGLAALAVLVLVDGPAKWIVAAVVAVVFWLPSIVRWVVAIRRAPRAFREGYRG